MQGTRSSWVTVLLSRLKGIRVFLGIRLAKKTPIINDFRAGELTPDMDARADLKDYYRGCRTLENAMPIIEGGVARVPGSYYVRPTKLTEEGWNIRVTKSGDGTGVVTSDVVGIDCGTDCYDFFMDGSTVVLTATPDSGMSFEEWSGDGTGAVTRSVLMDGNKVVNAEFSAIPLNSYLIGWFKVDEGSGLVVANSALDGSLGGGLFPNLAVRVIGGQFWTFLSGFGSTVGPSDSQSDHAFVNLGATRAFGGSANGFACYGMFYKQKSTVTVGGAPCSLFQLNSDSSGTGTQFNTTYSPPTERQTLGWAGNTVINNASSKNVWVFMFIDSAKKLAIVSADGTKVITSAINMNTALSTQFLHLGCRFSDGGSPFYGYYPCQGSYGDWIIYNNTLLTDAQWASWYDKLRSRYGMAARSGW